MPRHLLASIPAGAVVASLLCVSLGVPAFAAGPSGAAAVAGVPRGVADPVASSDAGRALAPGASVGRLVVLWRTAAGARAHHAAGTRSAGGIVRTQIAAPRIEVVVTAPGTTDAVTARLRATPGVVAVAPDAVARVTGWPADGAPNDPYYASAQPDLSLIGMPAAWARTTGSRSVVVAVLDTGFKPHADFSAPIVSPRNEITDTTDVTDGHGHGTHVTGTIAATTDDGIGVAGIAPGISIMPVKVLSDSGSGWFSDIAAGLDWARTHGAAVASMSLGGHMNADQAAIYRPAFDAAVAAGMTVVVAAGNDGANNAIDVYPANFPGVVTVASTSIGDARSGFSNAGPNNLIAAPGESIPSLGLGGTNYVSMSGTSMATPHVAAVVALMRSANSAITATDVKDELCASAVDLGAVGRDDVFGCGRLNAGAAVAMALVGAPPAAPGAPSGVAAAPGNGSATVSWAAPTFDGRSPITGYTATSAPGGFTCTTAGDRSCTVSSLTNGTQYTFTVKAANSVGTGPASVPSAGVTPRTTPGAPTSIKATPGDRQVVLTWVAPRSNGGNPVTGYAVAAQPGDAGCTTTGSLTCTVAGLTNGTAYTFTVAAINAAGAGTVSASVGATPRTLPGTPTGVVAVAGAASAAVSWVAPGSSGGSATTKYTVASTPGDRSCTTTGALACTVSGLTNGIAYTFRVTATNAAGSGAPSEPSAAVTPLAVPGAPGKPVALPGDRQALVTWTASTSDGGRPITGYTATSTPGSSACSTVDALSCTITGLANGTAYTFKVTATSAIGTSAASAASTAVTPRTLPGAPGRPVAAPGIAQATVTFAAPATNGGSAITKYTVAAAPGGATCTTTGALSCVVAGLTNNTAYSFTVTATNAAGTGPASEPSASATPQLPPGAPTGVAAVPGNASALVSWAAPAGNGGAPITGYRVVSAPGSLTCTSTDALACTVSGLKNGTAYTFTVTALSAVGAGPASAPSTAVMPRTVPSAPGKPVVTPGDRQVLVSWTAPSNGGSPIRAYAVRSAVGDAACATDGALTCTITGLANGTAYTFTVTATNEVGTSAPSVASAAATPRTIPGAPSGVTAVAGSASARIAWVAPDSTGGGPITKYTVVAAPGGRTCTTTGALYCTVSGLANGTAYTFTVSATNAAGTGPGSEPSAAATPLAVPGAPGKPVATPGDRQVLVTWTAPASDGGSPITRYTVTSSPGALTCTTGDALACIVAGLANGTSYTFKVTATNAVGTGPSSTASTAAVPVAPAAVRAIAASVEHSARD